MGGMNHPHAARAQALEHDIAPDQRNSKANRGAASTHASRLHSRTLVVAREPLTLPTLRFIVLSMLLH
jgi:hypothetical protein